MHEISLRMQRRFPVTNHKRIESTQKIADEHLLIIFGVLLVNAQTSVIVLTSQTLSFGLTLVQVITNQ